VTPILSHARELARRGKSFEVHYAAHSRERMAFRDAVEGYSRSRAFYYISSEGRRMDVAAILQSSPTESHIYVCGPPGLVDSVRETAAGLGLMPDQLHFESFGALWRATDESVHLELTLSGLTLDVPVGQTLLEAIETAGVWVPYDCRRGECQMCMTQVVEGQPVHRDHCLSQAERETSMTPCVSWARGSLTLKL
jgi:ferredoxin-NADP reductase